METKDLRFKLNIQLFAGDGDETENSTPTEEVENENLEENQEEETDPDFVDGEENDEEDNQQEAEDDKEKVQKEKSIKERNRQNYERRVQERQQKELEMAKKKAYMDGMKFAIGNVNPYTQEKIEDEFDLQTYQTMKEMEEKGLDPVDDYAKYVAQKQREERKAQQEQENEKNKAKETMMKEITDFDKKYGQGSAQKFLTDDNFRNSKLASKLGKLSLEEVYDLYTDFQANVNSEAEKKVIQKQAVSMSTPGKPGNQSKTERSTMEELLHDDKKFKEFQAQLLNRY